MGDADFEGLERRLSEQHDRIEPRPSTKARDASAVADTEGVESNVTPPLELIKRLDGSLEGAGCDQRFQIVWPSGPWKGKPITGYCAEPLCINEGGACTGPRFVPHLDQWSSTNPDFRTKRVPDGEEIIAASRTMAKRAYAQTHRNDERSDKQILDHVKLVWTRTIQSIRGKGDWRPT